MNGSDIQASSEDEIDEDFQEVYEGKRNVQGQPHGRGSLYFDSQKKDRFEGHFVNGVKEGKGCFIFSDGSTLSGLFINDCLEGNGEYLYDDGSRMVATYKNGELSGPSKEYDSDGQTTFIGQYENNIRVGVCQFYMKYGGRVFGLVDKQGKLSGKDVIYAYPDEKTFLKGHFEDGDMIGAFMAMYNGIGDRNNPYSYTKVKESFKYFKDVSTNSTISLHPLIRDCYEDKRVTVKKSVMDNAGEGLFSLIAAGVGEVMSFYNGIRVQHKDVDARDWMFNDNTISLDDEIVIDVPKEWASTQYYSASLGHKANHSFDPNCKYDRFEHPRFGQIKCIRTIRPVKPDEELTVAYGYDHAKLETDAPDWYKEGLESWNGRLEKSRTSGL